MPAAAQKIPAVPQELRVAKDYANWHLADPSSRVSQEVSVDRSLAVHRPGFGLRG